RTGVHRLHHRDVHESDLARDHPRLRPSPRRAGGHDRRGRLGRRHARGRGGLGPVVAMRAMHRARDGVLLLAALFGSAGCPALFGADSDDENEAHCIVAEVFASSEHVLLKGAGETVTWRAAATFSGVGDVDAGFERWWMAMFSLVAASNSPET